MRVTGNSGKIEVWINPDHISQVIKEDDDKASIVLGTSDRSLKIDQEFDMVTAYLDEDRKHKLEAQCLNK